MNCDEFKGNLHGYFVEGCDPATVDALEEHRRTCPECGRLMNVAEEMTCKDFTELLNDFVECRLPSGRQEMFERHLAICPDCTAFLDSYRSTMKLSALAMKPAMRRLVDEMPEQLVDAILAARAAEIRDAEES